MKNRQAKDELSQWTPTKRSSLPVQFWWGWGLTLALALGLVVLVTLPPFIGPEWRAVLMQGFSTVCHQLPDRSPVIEGIPLAVCHRCYGIYWGVVLAVVGYLALMKWDGPLNRYAPRVLLLALLPTGLDWMLGLLGIWHNTPISRLVTGGLLGIAAGYYLARAIIQITKRKGESL